MVSCSAAVRTSGRSAATASAKAAGIKGTWKGELVTNQHTPFNDPFVRPLFGGEEVSSGFTGKFSDDASEVFGTTLVGARSLSFHAVLKRLAEG